MYHSVADSDSEFRKVNSELARLTHKNSLSYIELTNYLKYISINYYISNIRELLYSIEKQLPTSTCTPFSKKVLLTNRNKLLPCERIDYRYSMGKVDEDIEFNIPEIINISKSFAKPVMLISIVVLVCFILKIQIKQMKRGLFVNTIKIRRILRIV